MRVVARFIFFIFFMGIFTILAGNILLIENIRFVPGESLGWLFFLKIILVFFTIGTISIGIVSIIFKKKTKQANQKKSDKSENPVVTVEGTEENTESLVDIITDRKEKVEKIPDAEFPPKDNSSGGKPKSRKKK